MTPEELPDVLTHVGPEELATALVIAWRALFGVAPARKSILVLLAQSALETGRWKSCHAWNLGNFKSRPGDGRSWTFYRCNEILNGKIEWFNPPHPQCRFRAFQSLQEGAVDYLGSMRRNFASAWPAVLSGDPRAFVCSLKAANYFTADEGPYEHSATSIFQQYTGQLQFQITPEGPVIDDATQARVLALVDQTSWELAGILTTSGGDDGTA